MDDLMVESEVMHCYSYQEVLATFGILFAIEDYSPYFGVSDRDISADIVKRYNLTISSSRLLRQKNTVYRTKFMDALKPKKGLMDLLKKLKAENYLMAVASGSQREEIKRIMHNLKIKDFFEALVSADTVKRGKPAPDLFLLVAQKLGVPPSNCLVLEDAPAGVTAAKKAGMKCFAIPTEGTRGKDFSQADKILGSLEEVHPLINV